MTLLKIQRMFQYLDRSTHIIAWHLTVHIYSGITTYAHLRGCCGHSKKGKQRSDIHNIIMRNIRELVVARPLAIRTHYTHVIMIIRVTCFSSVPGVVRLDCGLCTDRVCARRPKKIKIKIVHLR